MAVIYIYFDFSDICIIIFVTYFYLDLSDICFRLHNHGSMISNNISYI